ncbi:MAG: energy transducer TonB [Proteobacteria bacterium]|nr:energy transducer TonB [Pseudomonadota bacterium]
MKTNIKQLIAFLLILCTATGFAFFTASACVISVTGPQRPCFAPIITGSLNHRLVRKIVLLHENEIRHCYEKALLKDKTLSGKVTTKFTILSNGVVEKAEITESTLNNAEIEQCVVDQIETWEFYSIKTWGDGEKTIVEYPYVFVSNYKPPTILEHVRVILNEDDMIIEDMPTESPAN